MEIGGLFVVVAYFINRILSIEQSEFSLYQLTSEDHTCDVSDVIPFPGPVRSLLECAVGCLNESNSSNLCYNDGTSTCTCCSATSQSGPSTTKCYRRHETCRDGWTMAGGLCLFAHTELVDYAECKIVCDDSGGKILTPKYPEQISDALTYLEDNPGGTLDEDGRYWIGLIANTTERYRPWFYSDTGNAVTYFSWRSPTEPSGGTSENCIVMKYDGKWGDHGCGGKRSCVCQI